MVGDPRHIREIRGKLARLACPVYRRDQDVDLAQNARLIRDIQKAPRRFAQGSGPGRRGRTRTAPSCPPLTDTRCLGQQLSSPAIPSGFGKGHRPQPPLALPNFHPPKSRWRESPGRWPSVHPAIPAPAPDGQRRCNALRHHISARFRSAQHARPPARPWHWSGAPRVICDIALIKWVTPSRPFAARTCACVVSVWAAKKITAAFASAAISAASIARMAAGS